MPKIGQRGKFIGKRCTTCGHDLEKLISRFGFDGEPCAYEWMCTASVWDEQRGELTICTCRYAGHECTPVNVYEDV